MWNVSSFLFFSEFHHVPCYARSGKRSAKQVPIFISSIRLHPRPNMTRNKLFLTICDVHLKQETTLRTFQDKAVNCKQMMQAALTRPSPEIEYSAKLRLNYCLYRTFRLCRLSSSQSLYLSFWQHSGIRSNSSRRYLLSKLYHHLWQRK